MYLQRIWLAFLCLHRQLSVSNGGMCREEKSQLGFALLNSSYSTKQTSHYSDCVDICALDPQCMSFNFWWEKKICDLNSKAREHSCRACFVTDKSSTYMGMARYPGYPGKKNSWLEDKVCISDTQKPLHFLVYQSTARWLTKPGTLKKHLR